MSCSWLIQSGRRAAMTGKLDVRSRSRVVTTPHLKENTMRRLLITFAVLALASCGSSSSPVGVDEAARTNESVPQTPPPPPVQDGPMIGGGS